MSRVWDKFAEYVAQFIEARIQSFVSLSLSLSLTSFSRDSVLFKIACLRSTVAYRHDVTGRGYGQNGRATSISSVNLTPQRFTITLLGIPLSPPFFSSRPLRFDGEEGGGREEGVVLCTASGNLRNSTVSTAQILEGDIAPVRKFKSTLSLLAHRRNRGREKVGRRTDRETILQQPPFAGWREGLSASSFLQFARFILSHRALT